MKKVITFGASTSKKSINKDLAVWAANQVNDVDVKVLDLNDFEAPIYSIDRETEDGFPQPILDFKEEITQADGIVMSLAEHNGSYTAAFKNLYDWLSRVDRSVWNDVPMLLLASSPGPGGASGVLAAATRGFGYAGGNIVGSMSLPSFGQNFDNGISNSDLLSEFEKQLENFKAAL